MSNEEILLRRIADLEQRVTSIEAALKVASSMAGGSDVKVTVEEGEDK
jgi:hypothetical protein